MLRAGLLSGWRQQYTRRKNGAHPIIAEQGESSQKTVALFAHKSLRTFTGDIHKKAATESESGSCWFCTVEGITPCLLLVLIALIAALLRLA